MEGGSEMSTQSDEVEHVVFTSYKKKGKTNTSENGDKNIGKNKVMRGKGNELDMDKVRYEIIKFGMSGFEKDKFEEGQVSLAVKLGARPPKKAYVNYKEFKEQKKKEQEEAKAAGKEVKKKSRRMNFKQIMKTSLLFQYGKVGRVNLNKKKKKKF